MATLGSRQVNYVIESCKYHQHQDNRETDPKTLPPEPFGERAAAQRLNGIEQKVTAIEQWDRKQVQSPIDTEKHSGEMNKGDEPYRCHLPRHLGDPDRAAELVRSLPPRPRRRRYS